MCTLTVWYCQMFLIQQWDSVVASISCVHCFDLSRGYLSTFYHWAQWGVWEASFLIMCCCCCCCCFFYSDKNMSLHHAESPDSHVVYCRLTKGREVKTVTPVTWIRCHITTTGTFREFQSSRSEREQGKEERKTKTKRYREKDSDMHPY